MHFKQWMKLLEAIAPDVKEIILKAKWPASKEEVDKAIKSIEDSPESYDKKQAFSFMQKQFGLKSTEKQTITDPFIQEYKNKEQAKQITTEEFKTLQYFQNGNKELLKEMMDKLRELISTNKITLIFDTKPKIKDSNNEMLEAIISGYLKAMIPSNAVSWAKDKTGASAALQAYNITSTIDMITDKLNTSYLTSIKMLKTQLDMSTPALLPKVNTPNGSIEEMHLQKIQTALPSQ
jgi:hypothetical protein